MSSETIKPFYFDPETLKALAGTHREAYSQASPFPHTVIDNFLPESALDQVLGEFPNPEKIDWHRFNAPAENKKLTAANDALFPPFTRQLMTQFNSAAFLRFLEDLTGIEGLIPDPYFLGRGLHQIQKDGFLKIHTDFNWHTKLRLERRLNLLLYLNKNWEESYGGHLELWDKTMTQCARKVLPVFNRCVVFSTSRFSYHGHPVPLSCPEGTTRKSLALYYYTVGRPPEEAYGAHGTLYLKRPDENWRYVRNFLARCVPPIFYDLVISMEEKIKGKKRL